MDRWIDGWMDGWLGCRRPADRGISRRITIQVVRDILSFLFSFLFGVSTGVCGFWFVCFTVSARLWQCVFGGVIFTGVCFVWTVELLFTRGYIILHSYYLPVPTISQGLMAFCR
ncbi:hypothetical protein BZA05DRAFT_411061 [Tricharina praecox]|uniref:uncharacterized protein n=1 Tax=Tricharina praecox TaxID=43433 RepID=UPI002220B3A4|nr:uncharacterized protein BZA05DRAFT_411061 [Tricharina praecox]KAI5843253.1 hypothetical protein BZA05DRAFT_411061 [Tricharina praecox]